MTATRKSCLRSSGSWNAQEAETLAAEVSGGTRGSGDCYRHSGCKRAGFWEPHLTYRVGEFAYRISPTSFFQSARFLLPELVTTVAGEASGAVAIDLYAGVGLFTLPLAKRFEQVIAVEAHPQAAADLAANARAVPGKEFAPTPRRRMISCDATRRWTPTSWSWTPRVRAWAQPP